MIVLPLLVQIATAYVAVAGPAPVRTAPAKDMNAVLIVTATYPGASGHVVAETVAAPIEFILRGSENLVRIESESGNDGAYTARIYFEPGTSVKAATEIITKRLAAVEPILPEEVRRKELGVTTGSAKVASDKAVIVLLDRNDSGWKALKSAAAAVQKSLAADGTFKDPQAHPLETQQIVTSISAAKCEAFKVRPRDAEKVVASAGANAKLDDLLNLRVTDKVPLGAVATFETHTGPATVFRIDGYTAVRITGTPAKGNTVGGAAAQAVERAERELKRLKVQGVEVKTLSGK